MNDVVGIIGLGYVGAPLAYLTAFHDYKVIGIDTDPKKIDNINNRKNIPLQLKEKNTNKKYDILATSDYQKLDKANIIIICVPTPTTNNKPDTTILKNVVENLSKVIKNRPLIIVESTVAPGMTKRIVVDGLKKHNITVDKDYELAYCPERIDPGNKEYWVGNINRVCGSNSKEALIKAVNYYSKIIDAKIIKMNSIEESELVKVWENSTRNTLIAQSNLLAMICDKKNFSVNKVIEGLNSKIEQFTPNIAYPGIGPGGHCIPEDIHYLIEEIEKCNIDMNYFKESVKINEGMKEYAVKKLQERISDNNEQIENMNIIILGISYKANSDDTRKSQALELYNIMKKMKLSVMYFDPIVEGIDTESANKLLDEYLKKSDVVILGCSHDIFKNIDYSKYKIKYLLDCWNKYDKNTIKNQNIEYIGIGE